MTAKGTLVDVARVHAALCILALSLLVSRGAGATDFQLTDVRALGMGGALRASAIGTSALYLNPAGLTMSKAYHIETTYMFDDKYKMHYSCASVVDSVTSQLGMGLGYTFRWVGNALGTQEVQAHNLAVALSYAIIPRLSLGIGVHFIRTEVNAKHKLAAGTEAPGYGALKQASSTTPLLVTAPGDNQHPYGRDLSAFSLDAGLTLRIIDNIGLAVVGYNLTNLKSPFAPMMLGMGVFGQVAFIHATFDVLVDWDSAKKLFGSRKAVAARYMAGVEAFLGDHYPLRVGYCYDDVTTSHSIHWGLGYIARQGSVESGFSYEVNPGNDGRSDFRFMISLKYFAF